MDAMSNLAARSAMYMECGFSVKLLAISNI